jgi:hypothetical protein
MPLPAAPQVLISPWDGNRGFQEMDFLFRFNSIIRVERQWLLNLRVQRRDNLIILFTALKSERICLIIEEKL